MTRPRRRLAGLAAAISAFSVGGLVAGQPTAAGTTSGPVEHCWDWSCVFDAFHDCESLSGSFDITLEDDVMIVSCTQPIEILDSGAIDGRHGSPSCPEARQNDSVEARHGMRSTFRNQGPRHV